MKVNNVKLVKGTLGTTGLDAPIHDGGREGLRRGGAGHQSYMCGIGMDQLLIDVSILYHRFLLEFSAMKRLDSSRVSRLSLVSLALISPLYVDFSLIQQYSTFSVKEVDT